MREISKKATVTETADFKFSFIVPVYNVEKYLAKCLDSICSQSYPNIEIILVHDETGDKSGEICDRYALADPRIQVIHRIKGGVSSARNLGLEHATGDFILFVDSDDWISIDYCKKIYDVLVENKNIDMVMIDYYEYTKAPHAINLFDFNKKIFETREDIKNLQLCCITMQKFHSGSFHSEHCDVMPAVWAKAYRRACIEKLQFAGKKCEDALFNLYALQNCKKIIYIRENLYYYRKNLNSACSRYNAKRVEEYIFFYNQCDDFIKAHGDRYRDEYENALCSRIMVNLLPITKGTIAHPMNAVSFREKKKQLRKLTHERHYRKALAKYKCYDSYIGLKVKIIHLLLRMRWYGAVVLLASLKYKKQYMVERYLERSQSEENCR